MEDYVIEAISRIKEWALANGYEVCGKDSWQREYSFVNIKLRIKAGCFDPRYVALRVEYVFKDGLMYDWVESLWVVNHTLDFNSYMQRTIVSGCYKYVDKVLFDKGKA